MEAINLLKEEKDYKSAVSASALFWAISSIIVLIVKPFGLFSSYVDALPFVIVVSWLAGEIAMRMPKRIPVAYCLEHGWRTLPDYPIARFLAPSAWNNCVKCGRKLINHCNRKKHLLSVYSIDELPEKKTEPINCHKCGERIGEKFSVGDYRHLLFYLSSESRKPEDRVGDIEKYKEWKINDWWPHYPSVTLEEAQKRQQKNILIVLRDIIKCTEFDLLLDTGIMNVYDFLDRSDKPYIRKNHDRQTSEELDEIIGLKWRLEIENLKAKITQLEEFSAELAGLSIEDYRTALEKKILKELFDME